MLKDSLCLNASVFKQTSLKIRDCGWVGLTSAVSPNGLMHLLDDKLPE
jgi:hypothetical protein